jgi:hypothetical protein
MAEIDHEQRCSDISDAVAHQICRVVQEMRKENRRERRLIFALLAVTALAVATVGANLYLMIYRMSDDMASMGNAMGREDGDAKLMEESMKVSMLNMRRDMESMSTVMKTMDTMGDDMRVMSENMGVMTRDVAAMSAAVGAMTHSVGVMSTMTPAVQQMSHDTGSMGRDMHRMMPFNWMPFQ